ncbi:MAG: ABC transporter substrate-binding protein [Bacillota bacterium]|nr:ABC transporter substrate-binding protein [Bacillota bacterium]
MQKGRCTRWLTALAVLLSLLVAQVGVAAAAGQTRVVTDGTGRRVEIPAQPRRIVALTPWVVEVLFLLGHPPVGRPSSADYPPEALQIPAHGQSYRLNFERIAALQPDLIIGNGNLHSPYLAKLEETGAPVLFYDIDSYRDVLEKLRIMGEIVNEKQKAEQIVAEIERRAKALRDRLPARHPRVLIMVGSAEAWSAAKPNSYLGDLVQQLGAVNVAAEGMEHRPGFTRFSMERVVELDPDVILLVKPVRDPSDTSKALPGFQKDPLWGGLSAVKQGRVYELDHSVFMSPGPRAIDTLEELAGYLYPEVFRRGR